MAKAGSVHPKGDKKKLTTVKKIEAKAELGALHTVKKAIKKQHKTLNATLKVFGQHKNKGKTAT